MRPDRFARLLVSATTSLDGVAAELTPETDGRSLRPHLVTVQTAGRTSRWQVVAASAPGDRYDQPEREPVTGEKPAPPAVAGTPGTPEHLEAALVAAVLDADSGEIAAVDLYSRRAEPPAIGYGATIQCHSGAKIFLNRG